MLWKPGNLFVPPYLIALPNGGAMIAHVNGDNIIVTSHYVAIFWRFTFARHENLKIRNTD